MLLCSRCHAESGRTGTPCHLRLCFAVPGVWALAAMACAVTRRVAPRLHVSAWLHVPAAKGYGASPMGSKGGAFYIPANSNLLFDIEILGKEGQDL